MNLGGVYLPVTTPFRPDGAVDLDAFAGNLMAWRHEPVAGFLIGGSTGEAPLLEDSELLDLVERTRDVCAGEVAVLVGTGAESTSATIRLSRAAGERGCDAVLVKPPSYYRSQMTAAALTGYFLSVADASPVPVLLYHVPKYVPVDLVPDLAAELGGHENIIGIKDSSGDMRYLGELCRACEGRIDVLVGAGTVLYSGLEIGAVGGIVGVGLLATAECCEIESAWRAGRGARAGALQERVGPLHKRVLGGHGVPGVKAALDMLGLAGGRPRPPLLPVTDKANGEVADALGAAGLDSRMVHVQ